MGLTKNMIRLLLSSAQKRSLRLDNTLMVGRQNLHLNADQLSSCFIEFGFTDVNGKELIENNNSFAEGVFKKMGAKQVDSIDASDYEQATIIHDLNIPINEGLKEKYDLVLDSGTLEHVFNLPVALKSCMELTKLGGHFIGIYPCNNFFGHGFYQFSSELFYRAFSEENGFNIIDMIVFVDEPNPNFYSIKDTSVDHPRVQFTNGKPVYIYVVATKTSKKVIFKNAPLQMDYAVMKWKGYRPQKKAKINTAKNFFKLPIYFKNLAKAILHKKPPTDNSRFQKSFLVPYRLK